MIYNYIMSSLNKVGLLCCVGTLYSQSEACEYIFYPESKLSVFVSSMENILVSLVLYVFASSKRAMSRSVFENEGAVC